MLNAAFQTRVRTREPYQSPLKKGGLGYGSSELRYSSLLMRTQSCQIMKWTSINDVLFDKNVCVFHSLSWQVWLTHFKQRAVCLISVRL